MSLVSGSVNKGCVDGHSKSKKLMKMAMKKTRLRFFRVI